jgi:hypothetical protein
MSHAETLKRGQRLKRKLRKLVSEEPDHLACLFALGQLMTAVARKHTRTKNDALALPISVFLRQAGDNMNDVCERARVAVISMWMKEERAKKGSKR